MRANPTRAAELCSAAAASITPRSAPIVLSLKDVASAGELVDALLMWQQGDLTGLIDARSQADVATEAATVPAQEVLWGLALLLREHAR